MNKRIDRGAMEAGLRAQTPLIPEGFGTPFPNEDPAIVRTGRGPSATQLLRMFARVYANADGAGSDIVDARMFRLWMDVMSHFGIDPTRTGGGS